MNAVTLEKNPHTDDAEGEIIDPRVSFLMPELDAGFVYRQEGTRSSPARIELPPLCQGLIGDGESLLAAKMAYLAGLRHFFSWSASDLAMLDRADLTKDGRLNIGTALDIMARILIRDNDEAAREGPFRGEIRNADDQVIALVEERLKAHNYETPLNILEVGGGSSYPAYENFHVGAPWLSRALKLRFGDLVNIVVTDLTPLFSYGRGTYVHCAANSKIEVRTGYADPDLRPAFAADNAPVPFEALPEGARLACGIPLEELRGKVFHRPVLDHDFEGAVFGLEVREHVDFTRLEQYFMPGEFDIIFGRHLEPEEEFGPYPIESLTPFLAPGGELCLQIDGPSDFRSDWEMRRVKANSD